MYTTQFSPTIERRLELSSHDQLLVWYGELNRTWLPDEASEEIRKQILLDAIAAEITERREREGMDAER